MADKLYPVLTHGQEHVRALAVIKQVCAIKVAVDRLNDAIADIDQPIDMRDAGRLGEMKAAAMMIDHCVETIDIGMGRLQTASLGQNT